AGLAAGIGLAALLAHFGLPEGLGTFLLLALLAVGVIFVVRMLFARRSQSETAMAYAAGRSASPVFEMPSAPQRGGGNRVEPTLGSAVQPARSAFPPGFDPVGFAKHAKEQFIRLQAAYDAGDREVLTDVMTPEMIDEILRDLASSTQRGPTKVDKLDA